MFSCLNLIVFFFCLVLFVFLWVVILQSNISSIDDSLNSHFKSNLYGSVCTGISTCSLLHQEAVAMSTRLSSQRRIGREKHLLVSSLRDRKHPVQM